MPDTAVPEEIPAAGDPVEFELPLKALPDRLDKVLAGLMPEHSRSRLQGWIESGHVLVNGRPARVRQAVGAGDRISVSLQPTPESLAFCAEPVDFRVVAESPDWIVVDKPAGLVTHPGAGNWHGTLLNGLLHRYPELRQVARAGIVHRLDKDTSGLLVVARHERAQTDLVRQLQARTVKREYLALAHGLLKQAVTVARDIGRDPRVPVRMTVERPIAAKPAVTHCEPRRSGTDAQGQPVTLAACRLETGRTHQIRVHLASLGHPLVGDLVYGGRLIAGARRHMLHARALGFDDAAGGGRVSFEAEPPDDFSVVLDHISWQA